MRRFDIVAGGLLATLALLTAACDTSEVTSQPDKKPAGAVTSQATTAKVGDTITLKGNEEGMAIAVTVVKFVPKAQPADEFQKPERSTDRLAAIEIRLKNVGKTAYEDAPANGASVIDDKDQEHSASLLETSAGPRIEFPNIAPGDARRGYLTFEVPKAAKVVKFQFQLDSGFGPQSGQWSLR